MVSRCLDELDDRVTKVQGRHRDLVIGGHRFKGDIGSKGSSPPRIKDFLPSTYQRFPPLIQFISNHFYKGGGHYDTK